MTFYWFVSVREIWFVVKVAFYWRLLKREINLFFTSLLQSRIDKHSLTLESWVYFWRSVECNEPHVMRPLQSVENWHFFWPMSHRRPLLFWLRCFRIANQVKYLLFHWWLQHFDDLGVIWCWLPGSFLLAVWINKLYVFLATFESCFNLKLSLLKFFYRESLVLDCLIKAFYFFANFSDGAYTSWVYCSTAHFGLKNLFILWV